jgi:hypothetical protein
VHPDASEDPEQARQAVGSQAGDIGKHLNTPAPVSKAVSAAAQEGAGDRGYDDALSSIRDGAEDLAVALAIWQARDDGKPDAHARRAANDAVDAIDGALADLHTVRQQLISEIRVSDDATAARADALLARTDDELTSSRDQASLRPAGPGTTKPGARTPGPSKKERN